jgi:hypothetical protein
MNCGVFSREAETKLVLAMGIKRTILLFLSPS